MPNCKKPSPACSNKASPSIPIAHLDRGAIAISSLCLLHCLAVPVLAAYLPLVAAIFPQGELLHSLLIFAAIPITLIAMMKGRKIHRLNRHVATASLGLCLMVLALFTHGEMDERILTSLGGLTVITAHMLNWRAHQSCSPKGPLA